MDISKKPGICVVYCTAPPEKSAGIAHELLERRLVACVNISPVRSLYRWEGHICDESEDLLIIKTRISALDELITTITMIHPYEIPEVIAVPVTGGSDDYHTWVIRETE